MLNVVVILVCVCVCTSENHLVMLFIFYLNPECGVHHAPTRPGLEEFGTNAAPSDETFHTCLKSAILLRDWKNMPKGLGRVRTAILDVW